MRVLRVKGEGNVTKPPDLIVIEFKIISQDYDYDKVINDINNRTAILKDDIVKAGFSKDDLKTTNFSVNTEYKYQNGQNVFMGYKAQHDMKLEFDYNQIVLNNLLRTISNSKAEPIYRILFQIKDKKAFKEEVLNDAVINAKQNANVIANASSIKLGKILNITYDYRDIIYQSNVVLENTKLAANNLDIVPEDVTGSDTVIIEWEIEDIF